MHISIDEYPVFMGLGCFPDEQLYGQEILVSLRLSLRGPFAEAERFGLAKTSGEAAAFDAMALDEWTSDANRLDDTVDYGAVLQLVDSCLAGRRFALIESVVEHLAQRLLAGFARLDEISVTIEKRRLPGNMGKGARIRVAATYKRREDLC